MLNRPLVPRLLLTGWLVLAFSLSMTTRCVLAAPPQDATKDKVERVAGQFILITEPITSDTIAQVKTATRQLLERSAARGVEPIIVFEIRPGDKAPGSTEFGAAYDLATYISTRLAGTRLTVAFVPEPIKGYAALIALACDEIVMGAEAAIGPITPDGQSVEPGSKTTVSWRCSTRRGTRPQWPT